MSEPERKARRKRLGMKEYQLHDTFGVFPLFPTFSEGRHFKPNKPNGKKQWRPGSSFSTNGIELHMRFVSTDYPQTKTGKNSKLKKNFTTSQKDYDPPYLHKCPPNQEIVDYENDVCVNDPGNTNPLTGGHVKTNFANDGRVIEKIVTNSFRKEHLKHESKANKVSHAYAKLRDRLELNVIFNEYSEHSLKTTNTEDILSGIRKRVGHNDEVHRKLTNKKYLKLKFEAKIAYQRCMDQIANWCIHGYTTKTPFEKQDHVEKRKLVVLGDFLN